jgi:hypothetical protein
MATDSRAVRLYRLDCFHQVRLPADAQGVTHARGPRLSESGHATVKSNHAASGISTTRQCLLPGFRSAAACGNLVATSTAASRRSAAI